MTRATILLACAAFFVASVVALGGCKSSPSARFEGHWRGVRAEGVAADVQSAANAFVVQMSLDVKGDELSVTTGKEKQLGKFVVVKDDKTELTIVTDKDGPDDKQLFAFVDDKTMKWSVHDGKWITFVKQ